MTDGLSQLNSRRQAGRRVPPSQNPVRVNPAAATNTDAAATAPGPTPQPAPTPQAAAAPQPAPAPVQAKRAAPSPLQPHRLRRPKIRSSPRPSTYRLRTMSSSRTSSEPAAAISPRSTRTVRPSCAWRSPASRSRCRPSRSPRSSPHERAAFPAQPAAHGSSPPTYIKRPRKQPTASGASWRLQIPPGRPAERGTDRRRGRDG